MCLAKMHFPCGLEHLRQMHCDSRREFTKNNKAVAVCLAKTHFPCGSERLRQIHRDSRLDSQKCELLQNLQQLVIYILSIISSKSDVSTFSIVPASAADAISGLIGNFATTFMLYFFAISSIWLSPNILCSLPQSSHL